MAVFTGSETPYAQAIGAKKKAPDSVRENIMSDADINKSISDCITDFAEYATIIRMARRVMKSEELTDTQKYSVVKSMIGDPV